MNPPVPGAIVALVAHAREVPSAERRRFAARLRDGMDGQVLVLETCHRVEGYALDPAGALGAVRDMAMPAGGRLLVGEAAIRHAISVAAGRDSVVVGEDQVLHQLRDSVATARRSGRLDPVLERLFAIALQVGRRARSWHQGPRRSLADVALLAIERQIGPLHRRPVLVVGAGKMGQLAARAVAGSGASVAIANRSVGAAHALAIATGAAVEAFDPGPRTGTFAGIIVALGGPWPIGADAVEALGVSPTVVADLSVPPAVSDRAAAALGSRLVSADAMAVMGGRAAGPPGVSDARVDRLIEHTTDEFLDWLTGHDARSAAEELTRFADREREAELDELWRRHPDLAIEAREAIDDVTRRLAKRILRHPLERLGRDADGRDGRAVRDIFAL